ncbi:MAG: pyruvate formate-lyase-activating protein [Selenomonadaceae bacterium]
MKGWYHSKETFGTVDGPGIRYVLFLSGCGLGCAFCHNPDTWVQGQKQITAEDVLRDLKEYRNFYEPSGGGLTISGGEPLLQPDFVAEVFRLCRVEGIHTVLDTAGYCKPEALLKVLPYTDHVLFALKAAGNQLHRRLTLASTNEEILRNLRYIASRKPVTLRYVVIPGYTDDEAEITSLIRLLSSVDCVDLQVDVLGYHVLGVYKWAELGMDYTLEGVPAASKADVLRVREMLKQAGIKLAYE